jgi:hypothetical protein
VGVACYLEENLGRGEALVRVDEDLDVGQVCTRLDQKPTQYDTHDTHTEGLVSVGHELFDELVEGAGLDLELLVLVEHLDDVLLGAVRRLVPHVDVGLLLLFGPPRQVVYHLHLLVELVVVRLRCN